MITYRGIHLAAALQHGGVSVTLGAASSYALVSAADDHTQPVGETPVRVSQRAIALVLAKGALTLSNGASIVVNAGPFAGTYKIDHWEFSADGAQVEVLAR